MLKDLIFLFFIKISPNLKPHSLVLARLHCFDLREGDELAWASISYEISRNINISILNLVRRGDQLGWVSGSICERSSGENYNIGTTTASEMTEGHVV